MTSNGFIPPVISSSQPRLRVSFMDLTRECAGTEPVRFRRETIRDVWMGLELTDRSGKILEAIPLRIWNIHPVCLWESNEAS